MDGGGSAFPRGELDAASVHVEGIEVRDGDFLVLGSHDTRTRLDGGEAVKAVSGWMRKQQKSGQYAGATCPRRALACGADKMFVGARDSEEMMPPVSYCLSSSTPEQTVVGMTKISMPPCVRPRRSVPTFSSE